MSDISLAIDFPTFVSLVMTKSTNCIVPLVTISLSNIDVKKTYSYLLLVTEPSKTFNYYYFLNV